MRPKRKMKIEEQSDRELAKMHLRGPTYSKGGWAVHSPASHCAQQGAYPATSLYHKQ